MNETMHSDGSLIGLKDFSYELPAEQIASAPLAQRSDSRLLVYPRSLERIEHRFFRELPDILPPNSLLVANDTKVLPARLLGTTANGGKAELLLTEVPYGPRGQALALGKPLKRLRKAGRMALADGSWLTIEAETSSADPNENAEQVRIYFERNPEEAIEIINKLGKMPLPPYIRARRSAAQEASAAGESSSDPTRDEDNARYRTVFDRHLGSVAAPTAGLHFDEALIARLQERGHELCHLTLHVGLGTFSPVRDEQLDRHRMHRESYRMEPACLEAIERARSDRRPIIFVGTTSFRACESFFQAAAEQDRNPRELAGTWLQSRLFIYPRTRTERFKPTCGDGIITNFHLPESTLLMLISALIGLEACQGLYAAAIAENYRFYSYGDASLLFW